MSTAASESGSAPAEIPATASDDSARATTAAPNATTLPADVLTGVPDAPAENSASKPDNSARATTAAPNATTLAAEISAPVPDQTAEKSTQPDQVPNAATEQSTTNPDATVKSSAPIQELWALAKANGHPEIWGVPLSDPENHMPTQIVLQKYLNANDGDIAKAKDQLTKTLEWRAKVKPLELLSKKYSKEKFDGLGYVTSYTGSSGSGQAAEPEMKEVFTWNIYGGVKSIEATFGHLDEFIEWRTALMEMALQELDLSSATVPVTADYDPYKIFQVHDYKSISFLRSPPSVKSASQETIKIFAQNYPELLKEKFFVNVPAIMGFVYTFMKLFVAAKTIKKFHPMSNGAGLAREFGESKVANLGEKLPKEYGGKGSDLKGSGTEPALE